MIQYTVTTASCLIIGTRVWPQKKMHAARVAATEGTDSSVELPAINVGCSGWFYWHWKRTFYPEDLPTSSWFDHYSNQFQTVELNAPFYSWPTISSIAAWQRQAGDKKFIYTVKACDLVTYQSRVFNVYKHYHDQHVKPVILNGHPVEKL